MNGHDLRAENVVSTRNLAGDGDALLVVVVVEDGVGAPVACLLLRGALRVAAGAVVDKRALVDLEELELRLVDVFAVAAARGEVGRGPAVVAAVPAFLAVVAGARVVPGEGHLGAGGGFGSVGRGGGVFVRDDVYVSLVETAE